MKRIKVRVKEPQKVSDELAQEIYSQGEWLTHCSVEDRSGISFDFFTARYKKKTYFLVVTNMKVKECIEL